MRIRGYADGVPCWAELRTTDPAGAGEFYRELFGWQVDGDVFRLGGLAVAGLVSAPAPPLVSAPAPPSGWLTYLATDDLAALPVRVADGGGAVLYAPADAGTRGRAAVFADPGGAAFGAWQRGTFAGAQVGGEPNTVCWSELATRDEDAATVFYGKVFGWSAQDGEMAPGRAYREWIVGDRVVAGMIPLGPEVSAAIVPHWRTTVEVADIAGTVRQCRELGGRTAFGPIAVVVGRYAQLADPYGGFFGVVELIPELRGLPS
ncbi:MAG: hypothetical protein AUI14_08335 [Actinobacteria bacterium 13_2_20CM_2_71_6]|nr:MAG: hypothetical protein AUI14_08335 [Actinobacteria bacterium 13_2_20CM_2_71_6]